MKFIDTILTLVYLYFTLIFLISDSADIWNSIEVDFRWNLKSKLKTSV